MLVMFTLPVMAANLVTTTIGGTGPGTFNIVTIMGTNPRALNYDLFQGAGIGSLNGWHTVQTGESGSWTYDGADIDRFAQFTGGGNVSAYSDTWSTKAWSNSHSEQIAYVTSDATGELFQQTNFYAGWNAGVWEVDQWKKQRDMQILATGNYTMGFAGHDLMDPGSTYGDPATGNWDFSFTAAGDTSAGLLVDYAYEQTAHNCPNYYNADWSFVWTGSNLTQNTNARGDRGKTHNETKDMLNQQIWGNTTIW